jgi:hypothetical protein
VRMMASRGIEVVGCIERSFGSIYQLAFYMCVNIISNSVMHSEMTVAK